jgi:hypothetical protein
MVDPNEDTTIVEPGDGKDSQNQSQRGVDHGSGKPKGDRGTDHGSGEPKKLDDEEVDEMVGEGDPNTD